MVMARHGMCFRARHGWHSTVGSAGTARHGKIRHGTARHGTAAAEATAATAAAAAAVAAARLAMAQHGTHFWTRVFFWARHGTEHP